MASSSARTGRTLSSRLGLALELGLGLGLESGLSKPEQQDGGGGREVHREHGEGEGLWLVRHGHDRASMRRATDRDATDRGVADPQQSKQRLACGEREDGGGEGGEQAWLRLT